MLNATQPPCLQSNLSHLSNAAGATLIWINFNQLKLYEYHFRDGFWVYLFGWVGVHSNPGHSGPTTAAASAGEWNVNWQAIGYIC